MPDNLPVYISIRGLFWGVSEAFILRERENSVKRSFGLNRISCLLHDLQCLCIPLIKQLSVQRCVDCLCSLPRKAEHGRGSTCVWGGACVWERETSYQRSKDVCSRRCE